MTRKTPFMLDSLNRLTALNSSAASYSYQLGAVGNRTQATESTGRTVNWSYDGVYRLTNEAISNDPEHENGNVAYGLDPVGNRLSEVSSLGGVSSGSFGYNADDELSTDTYDNNGNTLATGGKTFTYDSQNQLRTMNGGSVTLIYDAFGNRVVKTANSVTTRYLVDDLNPTGLPQVMDEVVGGTVDRVYTYGLQRISEDQIVNNAWTASFFGYDGAGSVRQLTNSAGVVTDTYEYDAFGNKINSTGTTPNNYLYRGEQSDPDLSLYYLRARYYNPLTGRFLSVDSEASDGQRRYEYAAADPVDGMDPSGNAAFIEFSMLNFQPGRLGFIHATFPSWCKYVPDGLFPACRPPFPPPAPPKPPLNQSLVVKEDDDGKPFFWNWGINNFWERYVTYHAYYLDGESLGAQDKNESDIISLIESPISGSDQGICYPGVCRGKKTFPPSFDDDQRVLAGAPFMIRRNWYVNGWHVPVWNLKTSKPATDETLSLQYGKPFRIEYE